jgi:hypothetical protein
LGANRTPPDAHGSFASDRAAPASSIAEVADAAGWLASVEPTSDARQREIVIPARTCFLPFVVGEAVDDGGKPAAGCSEALYDGSAAGKGRHLAVLGVRHDNGRVRGRSPLLATLAGLLAVSFVLAACSPPEYRYVRDSSTRTAFRVPTAWTLYDEATVLGEIQGQQGDQPDPIRWLVGLDGDPTASVGHILNGADLGTDYPQGIAVVQQLSFVERDNESLSYLRNFMFPIDQLIQNDSNAKVVTYDDEIQDGNLRGLHMVISFREAALADARAAAAAAGTSGTPAINSDKLQRALLGGTGANVLTPGFVEFDQKAYVDDATHNVYLVIMLCSSECYSRNHAQIEGAVDSWTVSA